MAIILEPQELLLKVLIRDEEMFRCDMCAEQIRPGRHAYFRTDRNTHYTNRVYCELCVDEHAFRNQKPIPPEDSESIDA
jgi:RNase P subunit RPR2